MKPPVDWPEPPPTIEFINEKPQGPPNIVFTDDPMLAGIISGIILSGIMVLGMIAIVVRFI